nr:hypothetical protein Iba_chr11aCG12720 [Ipomoea batatas]
MNGMEVTSIHGDIRAQFDFPVKDNSYHPDFSSHVFEREDFWKAETTMKPLKRKTPAPTPPTIPVPIRTNDLTICQANVPAEGKAVDDDDSTPADPNKVLRKQLTLARAISHFEAGFVDPNPQAGQSNRNTLAEEMGDETTRAEEEIVMDKVDHTSLAEAEPLNDDPNVLEAEDATPSTTNELTE